MDKITLPTALNTDAWVFVWAAEPKRMVSVEMTYDQLWKIVQQMRNEKLEGKDG